MAVWNHVCDPPNHNMAVWVFYPDVGNDEEGYGFVEVAYYDNLGSGIYENRYGEELDPQPLLWADISAPNPPFVCPKQLGAINAALQAVTKDGMPRLTMRSFDR